MSAINDALRALPLEEQVEATLLVEAGRAFVEVYRIEKQQSLYYAIDVPDEIGSVVHDAALTRALQAAKSVWLYRGGDLQPKDANL